MRSACAIGTLLFAAALVLLQGAALAQVLYKWTDPDGKVQYSDQPPKNAAGPVTRIEPDEKAAPAPPTSDKVPKASKDDDEARRMIGLAAKKREARDKLEARVTAAREKLAAAKAELESAIPEDDEHMTIQQRVDQTNPVPGNGSASTGGMLGMGGMLGSAQRSNCTTRTNGSQAVTTCPTQIPTEAYYDRVKKLEDAVKSAEEELAAAESAYRRGVD